MVDVLFIFLGDLDGSDVHEDVGGDIDSKQTTKLPKSASSSGGFYQCSSKGLCKGDMSASHYNGGYFKLYVQDCCVVCPKNLFSVYRVTGLWDTIIRSGRAPLPQWTCEWLNHYALFGIIKAFWRFQQGKIFIGSYVSVFNFSLCFTDVFLGCVTGGCDENIFNVHSEFHIF